MFHRDMSVRHALFSGTRRPLVAIRWRQVTLLPSSLRMPNLAIPLVRRTRMSLAHELIRLHLPTSGWD